MNKTTKIIGGIIIIIIIVLLVVFYKPSPKEAIKIGAILPLTGKVAGPGQDLKNALELAFEDINVKNSVVELIYEDSQCDPQKAVTAYNSLVNVRGVKIIIGAFCSSETLAIAPLAEKDKIILITTASSAESISRAGDYIFRNHTKDSDEAKKLADFVVDKYKNLAIMYSISNDAIVQREKYFSEEFQKQGGIIQEKLSFTDDQLDFRTDLAKIKQKDKEIDAIYVLAYTVANQSAIIKEMEELGIQKQIIGDKSWATSELLKAVGNLAEGTIYSEAAFNRSTNPEFWDRFKERFSKEPPSWAAEGYDALMILSLVIFNKKCGIDTSCIKDELYKIKDYPGVAGNTTFDRNGDVIRQITIKTIKNGQFVPYTE